TQAGGVGEEEAGSQQSREPNMGLDPRTLGSCPEPKTDAGFLSHPGAPKDFIYLFDRGDTQRERQHKQGEWEREKQERFGNMTRVYYKEAVGAFIVFDISRGSTFEAVLKWKSDLDGKVRLANGSLMPAVLLANKCDQKKDGGQNPPQMDQFCKEHGFTGWFETSAKDNINIDEAARFLVENILANHQSFPNEENDVDKIKLDQETLTAESKSPCC
uniref:RAB32, member RAS oncogene family n=1 Tax=Ursus maritimus TaxID=29073 RepID=A0A452T899_URSMA